MSEGEDEFTQTEGGEGRGVFSVDRDFPLWADMNEAQKKQHSRGRDAGERDSDRYLTHFF